MRFLLLFAVAAVNLIFTGAVFPNINLFGSAPFEPPHARLFPAKALFFGGIKRKILFFLSY